MEHIPDCLGEINKSLTNQKWWANQAILNLLNIWIIDQQNYDAMYADIQIVFSTSNQNIRRKVYTIDDHIPEERLDDNSD